MKMKIKLQISVFRNNLLKGAQKSIIILDSKGYYERDYCYFNHITYIIFQKLNKLIEFIFIHKN